MAEWAQRLKSRKGEAQPEPTESTNSGFPVLVAMAKYSNTSTPSVQCCFSPYVELTTQRTEKVLKAEKVEGNPRTKKSLHSEKILDSDSVSV